MQARLRAAAFVCLTVTAVFAQGAAAAAPPPSGWTLPSNLEDAPTQPKDLRVAALPNGGALAVWTATDSLGQSYEMSSEYIRGEGWQDPVAVSLGGFFIADASLAVNAAGQGVLAWREWNGGIMIMQASMFRAGTGFAPQVRLAADPARWQGTPAVAIDGSGTAAVLFAEYNGTQFNEYAVTGDVASWTWNSPVLLEFDDTGNTDEAAGVMGADATGAVHGLWRQTVNGDSHLYATTFLAATGWSPARLLANASLSIYEGLQLAVLPDGRAVAGWVETNASGLTRDIRGVTYAPATGWSPAHPLVPTASAAINSLSLACGGGATCVAAWNDADAGSKPTSAVSLDAGATFSQPAVLDAALLGPAALVAVSMSAGGDGVVAWAQMDTPPAGFVNYHPYAKIIDAGGGLGPTERLDRADTQRVSRIAAAAGPSGDHAVAWIVEDGPRVHPFASVYRAPDVSPPKLRVTAPLPNAQLAEPSAVVTGQTDPGASVSVNGELALVRADGSFALRVPLAVGNNTIRVIAQDEWGNNETALVPVTVSDPTAALAAQLAAQLNASNLTIVYLTENLTTVEQEQAALTTNYLALVNYTTALYDGWNTTRVEFAAAQNASQIAVQRAESNATAAHEAAHTVQQRLSAMEDELNATRSSLAAAQTSVASAQNSAASATTVSMVGALAGIAGIALALMGRRHTHFEGGGTGLRQTPKRDFGDRMKAGLDNAAGIPASGASAAPRDAASGQATGKRQPGAAQDPLSVEASAEGEEEEEEDEGSARGPRQSTSLDGSYAADRDVASGMPTRSSSAPRDAASGQATGKRQHRPGVYDPELGADDARGPRQSTSLDGSYDADRDAASGRSASAPRDAASGLATGKRQHGPGYDVNQASPNDASRAPRDSATGQATGKRQHEPFRPVKEMGPAGAERQHEPFRPVKEVGPSSGKEAFEHEVTSPRDSSSGQSSGRRQYEPQAPSDQGSGQSSGAKTADGSHGGGGGGGSGIAVNEEGEAVRPPKKPPK